MTTQLLTPSTGPRLTTERRHALEEEIPKSRIWGTSLTKTDAEDLLDWLEMHGRKRYRVSYLPGEGFSISNSVTVLSWQSQSDKPRFSDFSSRAP
jgi:hypothetical protein